MCGICLLLHPFLQQLHTLKRINLTSVSADTVPEARIVIVEKDNLDRLQGRLSADELVFAQQAAQRDIKTCFFPRAQGSVLLRFLKADKDADLAREDTRLAGADTLREVLHYKFSSVSITDLCHGNYLAAFAEGMMLASFQFLKYVQKANAKQHPLREIQLDTPDNQLVSEINGIVDGVFEARRLVNEPHSYLTAPQLAQEALELGRQYGFAVEVLGKEKIESLKMGGLLAVNQASQVPPQFIVLEWIPVDPRNDQPVVLVGKGVVYDTGGYSIKPSEGMEYMKSDMGGAATVLGTFVTVAQNRLPIHLVGLIPATDNLVSETAIVPGDIIRMASGKTVEVMNTDAEGRLILADALHYAKQYKPQLVVDFATLTGAAVRALGNQAICYMGTASQAVKKSLEKSGFETYERLVEMPLWREYAEELKSATADLKNVGGPTAGAITAGKFLEAFVEGYPWLHLDIAGPSFLKAPSGYRTKEGTGVGVRLMYHFLKKM
jgi:leucyl aminopeptidase